MNEEWKRCNQRFELALFKRGNVTQNHVISWASYTERNCDILCCVLCTPAHWICLVIIVGIFALTLKKKKRIYIYNIHDFQSWILFNSSA